MTCFDGDVMIDVYKHILKGIRVAQMFIQFEAFWVKIDPDVTVFPLLTSTTLNGLEHHSKIQHLQTVEPKCIHPNDVISMTAENNGDHHRKMTKSIFRTI